MQSISKILKTAFIILFSIFSPFIYADSILPNNSKLTGDITATYKNVDKKSSFYTKTDVFLSTQGQTRHGLTYGAEYNLQYQGSSATQKYALSGTNEINTGVGNTEKSGTARFNTIYKVITGTVNKITSSSDTPYVVITSFQGETLNTTNQAARVTVYKPATRNSLEHASINKINVYLQGSFGRIDMGSHANASKSIMHNTFIRNAFSVVNLDLETYKEADNSIKYVSPFINGLQFAYSRIITDVDNKTDSAIGGKFGVNIANIDAVAGWTQHQIGTIKNISRSIMLISGNYAISYSDGESHTMQTFTQFYSDGANNSNKKIRNATEQRTTKNRRIGLAMKINTQATLTYVTATSNISSLNGGAEIFNTQQSLGGKTINQQAISIQYNIVERLGVGATYTKADKMRTWYIGATVTF